MDSQFPFEPNEEVQLEIRANDGTLVVHGNNYIRKVTDKLLGEELLRPDKKKD